VGGGEGVLFCLVIQTIGDQQEVAGPFAIEVAWMGGGWCVLFEIAAWKLTFLRISPPTPLSYCEHNTVR